MTEPLICTRCGQRIALGLGYIRVRDQAEHIACPPPARDGPSPRKPGRRRRSGRRPPRR